PSELPPSVVWQPSSQSAWFRETRMTCAPASA
ncbi:uncharacterized protein METZ01_LOCUS457511, partial [marine metagenome]